jgi:alginate production protein
MLTSFGLTFSMGSGGFDNNESNLFVQTGLQSNRNRYVGNHQYMYRFNDALRPDLTNLIQESFFLSYTFQDTVEIAGVLSMLQRNDNSLPIYSNSKPLHMNDHSKDVGTGFDVSLRYDLHTSLFNIPLKFIRLRSSAFFPGDAFNKASNDTVYRFVLELVGTGE